MQIVWLVNGNSNNADFQFQTAPSSLLNQGTISGLAVTTNQVWVGSALISVTSNDQTWLITYHNTSVVTIDTSGTKKVWIDVTQSKIDNGVANNEDGTGIAQINTGASYPWSGSYIPLASITGGVITDDRVFVSMKEIVRKWLTPNRVIATNGSGQEITVWGSAGQVLGFGAGGAPEAVSPTVDIAGLTSKTTPIGADQLIISDSEAGGVNKKISLKDAVIIADQTAQSAFSSENDLFVVKQASGGLRKMTVADMRRALINSSFNYTQAKISVWPSAGTANVPNYSSSYATWSNGGGMITALFKHITNGGSYVTGIVQISDDNSNWTTIWSEQWYENDSYPDYRAISLIFKAGYVRIWVARDFAYSWWVRIKWSATINITK